MNGKFVMGVFALAAGVAALGGGIGLVTRDEILGWLGIVGGTPPMALSYVLMRERRRVP